MQDENKTDIPADVLDRLPGDLRELAELIGLERTKLVVDRWGGGYLIIPKCESLLRDIRDNEIRMLYGTGNFTRRQLAMRYRLHIDTVNKILKKTDQDIPLPLLDLMNPGSE